MTAGPEDRTPYAHYLWGANAKNLKPQVLGKSLPNHLAPLLNSSLAQYVQCCSKPITWAAGDTAYTDLQNSTRELSQTWKFPRIKTMQEWSCLHKN